ncbi:MAG: hypothetical protein ACM31C_04635 [Acidobacteriota bacterium]
MPSTSDLAALVDAEASFDRRLAAARDAANAARDAARKRADEAMAQIDLELERERARIAAEITAATTAELRAIADDARAKLARYEAVHGDELAATARELVRRLAELVLAEAPP